MTIHDSLRQRWVLERGQYFISRGNVRRLVVVEEVLLRDLVARLLTAVNEFERVRQRMVSFRGKSGCPKELSDGELPLTRYLVIL